jgi:uncharacterized protein DUF2188
VPRKRFDVTVHPKGDGWVVQTEGKVIRKFDDKMSAIQEAVQRAQMVEQRGGRSKVVIHKRNGEFHEERTYGADPYPPAG